MGLTKASTGFNISVNELIKKKHNEKIIVLAGNPNVGKSTIFNAITGLKQHTGNWAGKTVSNAVGKYSSGDTDFLIVDIPGTYSLAANSKEEEIARDFICFGDVDCVIIVCDATCIERNLNLVIQTLEIKKNVIVCVNLADEAIKKNIEIDFCKLQNLLSVPVIATSAINNKGIDLLKKELKNASEIESKFNIKYSEKTEKAIAIIQQRVSEIIGDCFNCRWISIKLLENDLSIINSIKRYKNYNLLEDKELKQKLILAKNVIGNENITDNIMYTIIKKTEQIANSCVKVQKSGYSGKTKKIDKILTGKYTAIPIMLFILAIIFWITIKGANYPSNLLFNFFGLIQNKLSEFLIYINFPPWLYDMLILGVYRVLTWVIAVMLPPMAIFFPIFTLLEDLGYLPRVAFNMDKCFKKCLACGKQSLTMCMGFGCNAAGVVGCRIIDSPREKLIAIITNNFVPCNGRLAQPHKKQEYYLLLTINNFLNLSLNLIIMIMLIKLRRIEKRTR